MLLVPSKGSNSGALVLKSVALTTEPNLMQFMAFLAYYTAALCALSLAWPDPLPHRVLSLPV